MRDQVKIAEALKKKERELENFKQLVHSGVQALHDNLGHRAVEDVFCEFTIDTTTGNLGYITYGVGDTIASEYKERHATLELFSHQRMHALMNKGDILDPEDFEDALANNMYYQYRQAKSLKEEDYDKIKYLNQLSFSVGENGEIYIGEMDEIGFLKAVRRPITTEMQTAMIEWFLHHRAKGIGIQMEDGELANLLFTSDREKLERILHILKEE